MNCLKREEFHWPADVAKAFNEIKQRMTEALVMKFSDFSKVFVVVCDTSGIIIGGVLSQKKHHVAYFSKKLSGAKLNYSIYNKEFHVIVQSLRHWQHYLLQQEFVIYLDYETLRYLNFQKKFNARYGRWVEFLQDHTYTLKHMSRVKNKVVDALSRRIVFLTK